MIRDAARAYVALMEGGVTDEMVERAVAAIDDEGDCGPEGVRAALVAALNPGDTE